MRQARTVIAPLRADFGLFLSRSMLVNGARLFCCYPRRFDYARGIPFKGIVVVGKRWKETTFVRLLHHIVANMLISPFNTSENAYFFKG